MTGGWGGYYSAREKTEDFGHPTSVISTLQKRAFVFITTLTTMIFIRGSVDVVGGFFRP